MGTRHEVTGMLLDSALGPVLEVDGGGTWQLDLGWRGRNLFGRRVVVEGTRSGFNLLDVDRIAPAPPRGGAAALT